MTGPRLYIGSYTETDAEAGITSFPLDGSGLVAGEPTTTQAKNPSFLAVSDGLLYATHEGAPGRVSSYRRKDGRLVFAASTSTGGIGPAHVAVSADRRRLAVANYAAGSVAVIPTDHHGWLGTPAVWTAEGSGPNPQRQQQPHPHQTVEAPDGHWLSADLGTDAVAELAETAHGTLRCVGRHRLPPGTGPRHLVHRNGWLYVAGELDSRIHGLERHDGQYRWEWSKPSFDEGQAIACDTNDPSHIELGADRNHLYLANRGRDTIAVFAIDPDGGLTLAQERRTEGRWPRHFTVAGDRVYVANQLSNSVNVFALDPGAGTLAELLQTVEVDRPACVLVS